MNIFAARHKISTGRKFLKKFSSEKSLTGSSVDNPVVENGIVVSRSFYKKGYFRNKTWFSCGIPARINKTHGFAMPFFTTGWVIPCIFHSQHTKHTNMKFCGRIRVMIETLRMWYVVRYLKNNQHHFIDWDNRDKEQRFSNTQELVPQHIQEFTNILMQSRNPRILRLVLALQFGSEQYRKKYPPTNPLKIFEEAEKKIHNELIKKITIDAQLVISDCISADFIRKDEANESLIFLSLKGKKFATPYGLVKEWIIEDVGQMWSVIIGIVGIIGIIKWEVIWNFIAKISPWW